jgi:3-oxoadipate enol-lactonase
MSEAIIQDRNFFYQSDDLTVPWAAGEVVLLHHGYGRNHKFWYEWVQMLASQYRCLRFDMRGHGLSAPLATDEELTLEGLAGDVIGLMDTLGIEKIHFVGESLGGLIGIWLGALYPDRIKSLVLLSTPIKVSDQGRADFSAGAASWEAAFDKLTPGQWARQTMGHRFDPNATDPAYIDWAVEQAAITPVASLRKYARLIEDLDLSGGIPSVTRPTLFIAGGSKLAPPDQARFLQSQIPGAELEVLPAARHLVSYAMAKACVDRASGFWQKL